MGSHRKRALHHTLHLPLQRVMHLRGSAGASVPSLEAVVSGVREHVGSKQLLEERYWDTDDLRLARLGASICWRSIGESGSWIVDFEPGILATGRIERAFRGVPGRPPADAVGLVIGLRRGAPLRECAVVDIERSVVGLSIGGAVLAIVRDDLVSGRSNQGEHRSSRDVELTLTDHTEHDALLPAVRARLLPSGFASRELADAGRVGRVLDLCAADPSAGKRKRAKPNRSNRLKHPTMGELAGEALDAGVSALLTFDVGARVGEDVELLHQFRLSARRLRMHLKVFEDGIDEALRRHLNGELRWVGSVVGVVRDLDVLTECLDHHLGEVWPTEVEAATLLRSTIETERRVAHSALLRAIESDRYVRLLDALASGHQLLVCDSEFQSKRATTFMARQTLKHWRQVSRAAASIDGTSSDVALRDLRVLIRRCAGIAEIAGSVCDDAQRFAALLRRPKRALGGYQDSVVCEQFLRSTADAQPSTGILAGVLIERLRIDRSRHREAFDASWFKIEQRRELQRWME